MNTACIRSLKRGGLRGRVAGGPAKPRSRKVFLASLLIGAALLRLSILPIRITGGSMEPRLKTGDYLLMRRCWRPVSSLRRFEIVTARAGGELITKRVIGLPGEVVRMADGEILIDGRRMEEPFPVKRGHWTVRPGLIGEASVLLVGDNREAAEHSFFVVPFDAIVGRELFQ